VRLSLIGTANGDDAERRTIMQRLTTTILAASALFLASCNSSADAPASKDGAESTTATAGRADPRLPAGFTIYTGEEGAREFVIAPAGNGQMATFSVAAPAPIIRDFYERQAVANGMQVTGRVTSSDLANVDARREGTRADTPMRITEGQSPPAPRTFGAMAVDKGPFTNVTLSFDVTP
jgi:hypothetical protein